MHSETKQVIVIRKDIKLKRAEIAALASRASLEFLINNSESKSSNLLSVELTPAEIDWINDNRTTIVVSVPNKSALQKLIFKSDIKGIPYYTLDSNSEDTVCAAFGPEDSHKIDEITGNLKLI